MVTTVKRNISPRGTTADINAETNFVSGSYVYDLDLDLFRFTHDGGATPTWFLPIFGGVSANTTDTSIDISGIIFDKQWISTTDAQSGGAAYTLYNSGLGFNTINFRRARGTEALPEIVTDGSIVGGLSFSGLNGDLDFHEEAAITASIDGTPTATTTPIQLLFGARDDDLGTQSLLVLRPMGTTVMSGTGPGPERKLEVDFEDEINLKTSSLLLNGSPFPMASAKSYASMYFSNNTVTNTTYSAPSTPTQVLAPAYTAGSHFNGFTHLAGVLTKTSPGTQSFLVTCPMTARSGTINTLYNFHVAIDTGGGFLIETSTRGQVYLDSTDSNARNPVAGGIIELSQGDQVAVYSSNTVSTQFSRVECLSFSIVEI